ncbi:MAG: diaminopimelate epimerase [Planctomycetota bacterium]
MKFTLVSGTGNNFALFDGFADELLEDAGSAARELCRLPLAQLDQVELERPSELRLDGILLLMRPREGGDCRMVVYNADGSRPESCGNGLRCIALVARERGHVGRDEFTIETDAGPKAARVIREGTRIVAAEIAMGEPRLVERRVTLKTGHGAVEATLVELGNPHCVIFVRDPKEAPVAQLGAEIERHRHFPGRTNVEFVAVRPYGLEMRVWERGVGETAACGTGACAAAVAAVVTQRASSPLEIRMPGGVLHVAWTAQGGEVRLSGPCETQGKGNWRSAAPVARPGKG